MKPEELVQEVKTAVDELRTKQEKYGTDSVEFKAAMEKTEGILAKQEELNQKLTADLAAETKARVAVEDQVKDLELEIARKAEADPINYKNSDEYKLLNRWCQRGEKNFGADELKTLRSDIDTQGGYLTMPEMDTFIIKKITEISPVRSVARVRSVSKKTLEIPVRTGIPTATYEGEAQAGDSSEAAYGNEQLTTFRLTVTVPYTMDLLMDSSFDLEAEINGDVAEAFAFTEGNKFVLGTGAKQPEGFLVHPDVVSGARTSGTSGSIAPDDLLLITGDLKVGYNPLFGFNRQTLAFLRTLKDSQGQYLWQIGLAPDAPNTIAGEPYVVMQDMPSIAVGALSLIYGDFARGYTITDRTGLVVVRDELTRKKEAIIELTFHRWNTGQVVLSEAFKALEIAA